MYPRIVRVRDRHGTPVEYVRLVESYREGKRVKQRIVAHLGRKDVLAEHLDRLLELLRGPRESTPDVSTLEAHSAAAWGPVLVARHLWTQLGLDEVIRCLCTPPQRQYDIADLAFVLVASRLCRPSSEHALAWWLEEAYVCTREGCRFLPQWERTRRVRIAFRQLYLWYRTLDALLAKKAEIEQAIYFHLRDLFSLRVQIAFYDLTSTFFEGRGPEELGRHGYSRDHRPREKQILVGVVMVNGWPIAHHVFRGNLQDHQTVVTVLADLRERFGLQQVAFVGDRGMASQAVLAWLEQEQIPYLVGLQRRRRPEVTTLIEGAQGEWIPCPLSQGAREKTPSPVTYVQEVERDGSGRRYFVVRSDERLEYERTLREKAMARVEAQLKDLQRQVTEGKLKKREVIGARAQAILSHHHGHRYFAWKLDEAGGFHYFEHPVNLPREKALEGKYVLQASRLDLDPVGVVAAYKELAQVEHGFRHLKDVIALRPVYHQTDHRVQGHVFVAALAFLLLRALERGLREQGVDLGAEEALQSLETIRVVEFEAHGAKHQVVTRPSTHAALVLKALGIKLTKPPSSDKAAVASVVPKAKTRS
ncbi:MAG: IS1634 family transposase [Candidatus Methylomirabilales bacterium]